MRLAASRLAPVWLALISFAESSFFPLPPDVMLAPMILAKPERSYQYAAICTVASVLGGILGYAIGFYLAPFAEHLLAWMGHPNALGDFQAQYARWGAWVIIAKGVTPIPYKLVTIASGLAHFSFVTFLAASVVTRGARFFIWAWVLKRYGPSMLPVVERRLGLFALGAVALAVLGVVMLKLL
jgi:membrane protein YqaA with SNARE-associated domain